MTSISLAGICGDGKGQYIKIKKIPFLFFAPTSLSFPFTYFPTSSLLLIYNTFSYPQCRLDIVLWYMKTGRSRTLQVTENHKHYRSLGDGKLILHISESMMGKVSLTGLTSRFMKLDDVYNI